jgi:hypothetical protein
MDLRRNRKEKTCCRAEATIVALKTKLLFVLTLQINQVVKYFLLLQDKQFGSNVARGQTRKSRGGRQEGKKEHDKLLEFSLYILTSTFKFTSQSTAFAHRDCEKVFGIVGRYEFHGRRQTRQSLHFGPTGHLT